jgi:hypothetical protein
MEALIAALALVTLFASPTFAQTVPKLGFADRPSGDETIPAWSSAAFQPYFAPLIRTRSGRRWLGSLARLFDGYGKFKNAAARHIRAGP